MSEESQKRARVFTKMLKHGARQVEVSELYREAQVAWRIGPEEELSETCIHLEEFLSSAARNSRNALRLMDRMRSSGDPNTDHLTALKKYVEDTCEAIKVVDNTLRGLGSSLDSLLFEVPREGSEDELTWRSLIGRRDVIAHDLLAVDDNQVHREASRDFNSLHQLLSRVYFVPAKTDYWGSGRGFSPLIKADAWKGLSPSENGRTPRIGESLVFVCEDKVEGFLSFRFGRTEGNRVLMSASLGPRKLPISIHAFKSGDEF